MPLVADIKAAQ